MNRASDEPSGHAPARRTFLAAGASAWVAAALEGGEQAQAAETEHLAEAASPWPGRIKALTFDVFGTVTDWHTSIVLAGQRLSQAKGLRVDWSRFAADWRAGYRPALEQIERGEAAWTNIDGIHRRILDGLLRKYKIEGLSEAEIVHLNRVWHRLLPWADAVSGLNRLRCRYTVAALSNGSMALLVDMAKNAGLPWDCVLSAELAKHYKPAAEVYQTAARLLDLEPAQIMMVTAHDDDLQGARRAGLKTAFVSRPLEHGPGGAPPQIPAEADVSAGDFLELAAKLGA